MGTSEWNVMLNPIRLHWSKCLSVWCCAKWSFAIMGDRWCYTGSVRLKLMCVCVWVDAVRLTHSHHRHEINSRKRHCFWICNKNVRCAHITLVDRLSAQVHLMYLSYSRSPIIRHLNDILNPYAMGWKASSGRHHFWQPHVWPKYSELGWLRKQNTHTQLSILLPADIRQYCWVFPLAFRWFQRTRTKK